MAERNPAQGISVSPTGRHYLMVGQSSRVEEEE